MELLNTLVGSLCQISFENQGPSSSKLLFMGLIILAAMSYISYKLYKKKNLPSKAIPYLVAFPLSALGFLCGKALGIIVLWDLSLCVFIFCLYVINNMHRKRFSEAIPYLIAMGVFGFLGILAHSTGHFFRGLMFDMCFAFMAILYSTIYLAKAAWDIIKIVIHSLITPESIKREIRFKCPEAMKIEIQKEKQNCVECGIRDKNNKKIAEATIESDEGVSETVYEGQVILA